MEYRLNSTNKSNVSWIEEVDRHVLVTVRYQELKIGQEFEEGTDTRGQTFNNWGGNGGQQTNQRYIISRNVEQCKWCNRPGHTMSNCYVKPKFEDESNVMEQAQVASVFVNNAREQKRETK